MHSPYLFMECCNATVYMDFMQYNENLHLQLVLVAIVCVSMTDNHKVSTIKARKINEYS